MEQQKKHQNARQYAKIQLQQRKELIHFVEEQGFCIAQAARALDIKSSTAKLIISKYRKHGKIFARKSELAEERKPNKKKQNQQKESSEREVNLVPQTANVDEIPQTQMTLNMTSLGYHPFNFIYVMNYPYFQRIGGAFQNPF